MESDLLELSRIIGENHSDLKEDLGNIKALFSEFKGQTATRLETIEARQRSTDSKQWYHSIAVSSILGILNQIGHHFGLS